MKAKIKISANQEQLNVVGFLSSFVLLVSLSHFSFVSTCVYPGERRRVARPPLALARGAGVQRPHSHWRGGRGEASPGGRGRFHFSAGFSSAGSLPRHRASSLVVARDFRTRSLEGLKGFGGTIVVLSDVGSFLLLGPPILLAGRNGQGHLRGQSCLTNSGSSWKTSGALIVTVVVTIQGSARALKHARAPSRPGTNGGAQM